MVGCANKGTDNPANTEKSTDDVNFSKSEQHNGNSPTSTPTQIIDVNVTESPKIIDSDLSNPLESAASPNELTQVDQDVGLEALWFFYNLLDSPQKEAYLEVYNHLVSYINSSNTEKFSFTLENSDSELDGFYLMMYISWDNPVIAQYFVSNINVSVDNGNMVFWDFSTVDTEVFGDITAIRNQIHEIEAAADAFLSDINLSLSDYERYLSIATKLCQEIVYDHSFGSPDQSLKDFLLSKSVYGGLINHLSVCQGFTQTYQYLCQRAGLFSTNVNGRISGIDHEWNIIRLDDGYYHVDTTWMQTYGDRYFCLTDAQIAATHLVNSLYHPTCNGVSYAYDNGEIPT
jgi:transglutaminase/protease-like cytokinesis protein 3